MTVALAGDAAAFMRTAEEIGAVLTREAVWHTNQCTWMGVVPDEGGLQRVECASGREPLDRRDRIAVVSLRQSQTCIDRLRQAVGGLKEHRAGSAFAALARRLRARQMKLVS